MKRILKYIFFPQIIKSFFLLIITMFICTVVIYADTPDNNPDPDAPIDGGLSLVIAAGVGLGIKRLKDNEKNKQ